MTSLKYTIIKSKKQYNNYCNSLEDLICVEEAKTKYIDEIELLELLISKWDIDNNSFKDLDPIQLLKALMLENNLKSHDLVNILSLSKGSVSKILNYRKGLSKLSIRKLSAYFKVSQEAFNKYYKLVNVANLKQSNAKHIEM